MGAAAWTDPALGPEARLWELAHMGPRREGRASLIFRPPPEPYEEMSGRQVLI